MIFPVPMEQAYNTLASYIRNAPLPASLSDPLAACTGIPDRPSSGGGEGRLPSEGMSGNAAKLDAQASKDAAALSSAGAQPEADGSFFGSTRSGSSSLSDAFRLFQEKMRTQLQHMQHPDEFGTAASDSAETENSPSSFSRHEDRAAVVARDDGIDSRVVGERVSDGVAAPVREGVCLSASGHVRRSASVPPAAAKVRW